MSGYDIQRSLKRLTWLISSPSSGSLYPVLYGLLEGGLATVEVVPNLDRPPRKIYSITAAGRKAVQHWAGQPTGPDGSLREFTMRLLLAGCWPKSRLIDQLEQRHRQVTAHRDGAIKTLDAADVEMDLGQRLALEYGLFLSEAELAWLEHTIEMLATASPPEKGSKLAALPVQVDG